ncbi:MAG: aminomethyl-transferring glycine dehydrogenase subunit GcvPA [Vulcanimicrobiota bacterium]
MKYIPHTPGDIEKMLSAIGVESIDALFSDIPKEKKIDKLDLPDSISELELVNRMKQMSGKNRAFYDRSSFLGAGIYWHFTPSVIDSIISRSEFYTSYTPYQAEASQGILQSIFEYQTMIANLTGMEVSNASLYDGSTAVAEAITLATMATRKNQVLYSQGLHPEYVEVIKTYFKHMDGVVLQEIPLIEGNLDTSILDKYVTKDTAGLIVQNPNCLGFLENLAQIGTKLKQLNKKSLLITVVTEPVSLGILKTPGACGADIVVGEGASFGLPPSFGGPHLGFMATTDKFLRKIPGRLVGQTIDEKGRRAFCLTLQAREQHIRREKASSNICTNQALCALAATIYLACMGKKGFRDLAKLNLEKAHYLKNRIVGIEGFDMMYDKPFFNEFTVKTRMKPEVINTFLASRGTIGGFITGKWKPEWKNAITFCVTEMNTRKQMDDLSTCLKDCIRQDVKTHV